MKHILIPLAGLLALTPTLLSQLANPGFEAQEEAWTIREKSPMSSISEEAAAEGKFGLRVEDKDEVNGSSAVSDPVAAPAGSSLELTFTARTEIQNLAGVYLWFHDGEGKLIKDETQAAGQGHPVIGVRQADGQWHDYSFPTVAPEGAATVSIWVHTFGRSTGLVDFDNFAIHGAGEHRAPAPKPAAAATTATPAVARAKPPVIIIKIDDLRQIDGRVHPLWDRVVDYLKERQIKCSIGVIAQTLEEATPEYCEWIKSRHASGDVEFWFHGWDHATHDVNGTKFNEFKNRPYEEQLKRFTDSQALAKEKLGFAFTTFGPPGGASNGIIDETTVRVMADEPDMKVWLYPQPLDAPGQALAAAGKVTILDRVWAVNLESKVGQPDFASFSKGYAQNPQRDYFVLQGHPMSWGTPVRWMEFTKIIDFLVAQNAEFVTPSAYAASLRSTP